MKLASTNPARNYEVIGEIEVSTENEVKRAVAEAKRAAAAWRELGLQGRIGYFEAFVKLYDEQAKELAELQTKEMGKTISESNDDIAEARNSVAWLLENAEKYLAPEILDETEQEITELHKEPYGMAAAIAPWNFPVFNFLESTAQLLLCGNAVVFKHSEECPLTGKKLADLMAEAGFPKGVFTEIYGGGDVGQMLVNEDVDFISFTGSSAVGKKLYQKAAEKLIPVRLELGGSSPGVIFEDADLNQAIPNACQARFLACGQVCDALKRLLVHESIFDQVVEKLKNQIEQLKLGDPLDKTTSIGPLVAKRQQQLLKEQLDDAVAHGAKIITGGRIPEGLKGAYFEPTLATNVAGTRLVTEEVFGPILTVQAFKDEEEAIKLANDTLYGLSAYVYSGDQKRAQRVAGRIRAGQVSINGASYLTDHAPFGGYKDSGIGRGSGKYGFYESTQSKVIAKPKS